MLAWRLLRDTASRAQDIGTREPDPSLLKWLRQEGAQAWPCQLPYRKWVMSNERGLFSWFISVSLIAAE